MDIKCLSYMLRRWKGIHLAILFIFLQSEVLCEKNDLGFTPAAVASCSDFPYMKVTIHFNQNFNGVVYAVDHRESDACRVFGNGDHNVTLILRVTSDANAIDDCGVQQNEAGHPFVNIFVRYHKTLERSEDKQFSLTCEDPSYVNSRGEENAISMVFLEDGHRTNEVVQGRQYILSIQQSKPDDANQFKVKKCYSAGSSGPETVSLTDDRGCPIDPKTMSRFRYNSETGTSAAVVFSMFKFPSSNRVGVTCLVAICRGSCFEESCDGPPRTLGRSVDDNVPRQFWTSESVFVVDPSPIQSLPLVECTVWRFPWLIGLCIAFGILFLIMLIVNILLCSALTCSCAKQEVIERDPSVIEDYDPYKTGPGWGSGSQYGSRYSLNGKHDYPSGGSTLNSTTRSFSTNSDHYAVVHNHPGSSRYHGDDRSSKGGYSHGHHQGPGSTISAGHHSGHHSGHM